MKAIVQDSYGAVDVLRLDEIETPTIGDDEVLVRVRATSVHPDIWHVMSGQPYALRLMGAGLRRPKNRVPGTDMAGCVEAVGKHVTQFKTGDEVFGETVTGYQWDNGGTFAEYVAVKQGNLALKPSNLSFEQAAALPTAGLIVLNNLRGGAAIQPGQHVLINGAAGGVGAIAVQIAKARGAHVTGVDAPEKLATLKNLGADEVIDYTRVDFTRADLFTRRYDLVFDIPGNHPFSQCKRVLAEGGKYVLIGHEQFGTSGPTLLGLLPAFFKLMFLSFFSSHLLRPNFDMPSKKESLEVLRELAQTGKLTVALDRCFPLEQACDAMRFLQTGKANGKIVLTV
jgi:NADPH:quinone reductase-like Zn-dependent oxidoreductase